MNVGVRPFRVLSLCSGIGGLELGIRLAVPGARCVGYVERDAFAAACLVARMEDAALDPAPVADDLESFDGRPWRGAVDCIAAGFPCQPFSTAGSRRGSDDERHVWPELTRIVREVGPSHVFLENVRGLLTVSGGRVFGAILGDLADLGLDAEWCVLGADAAGAPHRRERVFLLATRLDLGPRRVPDAERDALREQPERGRGPARSPDARDAEPRDVGKGVAVTKRQRRQERAKQELSERVGGRGSEVARGCGDVGDAHESRPEGRDGPERASRDERAAGATSASVADAEHGRRSLGGKPQRGERGGARGRLALGRGAHGRLPWPPGPADERGWREWLDRGGPAPAVEPGVRGGAHGLPARVDRARADRLRCLGNAVVPDQAALAWRVLEERLR